MSGETKRPTLDELYEKSQEIVRPRNFQQELEDLLDQVPDEELRLKLDSCISNFGDEKTLEGYNEGSEQAKEEYESQVLSDKERRHLYGHLQLTIINRDLGRRDQFKESKKQVEKILLMMLVKQSQWNEYSTFFKDYPLLEAAYEAAHGDQK